MILINVHPEERYLTEAHGRDFESFSQVFFTIVLNAKILYA
jgi:hypothetical protein